MDQQSLRINIGFIVHEELGYSREFEFDFPELKLEPDLHLKNLKATAKFSRTTQGLLLEMTTQALTPLQCARCLDMFGQQLDSQFTELFAFDERSTDEAELTVPRDGMIYLAPLLREYLILEIPIKPICKPDCSGIQTEEEGDQTEEFIDPRLAPLKDLLDNEAETDEPTGSDST